MSSNELNDLRLIAPSLRSQRFPLTPPIYDAIQLTPQHPRLALSA